MMSHPKDISTDYFVCDQDVEEYVGLLNIKGFNGEPVLTIQVRHK